MCSNQAVISSFTILISVLLAFTSATNAQITFKGSDSSYYHSYDTTITSRVYFSQKYLSMVISGGDSVGPLKYRPNSNMAIGLGATYGWLTLNASVALGFLNPGDEGKGKTKNIDLQAHLYGKKMTVDLFGQYYKGFYLYPKGTAANAHKYYIRPDISLLQLGISADYILNWRRFSSRAAFLQNEWQTKSAGSFLLGAEFYYGRSTADSALVPTTLGERYKRSANITGMRYGDIGVGAGYAYTLVIDKNWFLTGSLSGSISIDIVKEWQNQQSYSNVSFRPNYAAKVGIGYNSRRFTTSVSWVNNTIETHGSRSSYRLLTGNTRLHVAYRFHTTSKLRKILKPFRKI
jgi:hypothetical protein